MATSITRNGVLNTMGGTVAGAQGVSLGWAIVSAAVSAVATSQGNDVLPMFGLGMAGWAVGRTLFPPPILILP